MSNHVHIDWVRDETVDREAPCPHCDCIDAVVQANVYVKNEITGAAMCMHECCLACVQRTVAAHAELLVEMAVTVEVPASLRSQAMEVLAHAPTP